MTLALKEKKGVRGLLEKGKTYGKKKIAMPVGVEKK